jgi:hypothetical protein
MTKNKKQQAAIAISMKAAGKKPKAKMAKGGKASFGMLSVKAGIDKNPKPTFADKIAGAKKGKMKKGGTVKPKGCKTCK